MAGVRGSRKRRRYDQNVSTTAASGSTMKEEPQDESSRRKNVVSPRPRSGEPICSIGYSFGLHYKIVSDITWQFVESMEQKGFEHLKRPSTEIDMKGIEKLNGIPNSNRVIDATHFNLCLTSTKPSFYVWLDHNKHSMVMNAIVDPESVYKIGESGYSPLPCPVVPYEQKVREDILMEQSSIGFFKEKTNIEYPGTHVRVSTKGSCAPAPKPADDDIDFTNLCKLYVEDPNLRSVAYEKMHEYSTTIHHKPIVEFPRPEPDIDHISSLCILEMIMEMDKSIIEIRLPSVITGLQETTISYINHGDIKELCSGNECLCITVIQLWIVHLYHLCTAKENDKTYGFLDPNVLSQSNDKKEEIRKYIQDRICQKQYKCYLAPYVYNGHWQLIIICPSQNTIVLLCSMWWTLNQDMKDNIDSAMKTYHMFDGMPSRCKNIIWICPKSRRQIGGSECGYYVMGHMFNIVSEGITNEWSTTFCNSEPFSKIEIEDIRIRWAKVLLEIAHSQGVC